MEANQTSPARVAAKIARKPDGSRRCVICPGGIGFEIRSASGGRGAGLSVVVSLGLSQNKEWCALQVSNLRPLPCEGNALPLS